MHKEYKYNLLGVDNFMKNQIADLGFGTIT